MTSIQDFGLTREMFHNKKPAMGIVELTQPEFGIKEGDLIVVTGPNIMISRQDAPNMVYRSTMTDSRGNVVFRTYYFRKLEG